MTFFWLLLLFLLVVGGTCAVFIYLARCEAKIRADVDWLLAFNYAKRVDGRTDHEAVRYADRRYRELHGKPEPVEPDGDKK